MSNSLSWFSSRAVGLSGMVMIGLAILVGVWPGDLHTIDPGWLGTVTIQSGTTLVKVATTGVPADLPAGKDARIKIKNDTGRPMTDLTFRLSAIRPTGSTPPGLLAATAALPGGATYSATAGGSNTVNIAFGASSLADGAVADCFLDLGAIAPGSVPSDLNDLEITPSTNAIGMGEVDWLGSGRVAAPHDQVELDVSLLAHDKSLFRIQRAASVPAAPAIIGYEGRIITEEGVFAPTAVTIVDPANNHAPLPNLTVTFRGQDIFIITGLQHAVGHDLMLLMDHAGGRHAAATLTLVARRAE